jgi:1-acyl-sn-glycerol-3-phosphate acyltransferase
VIAETIAWIRHARRVVPRQDRAVLLSPPRLVARFWRFARARHAGASKGASADDVRARDPEFAALMMDFFDIVGRRYFRLRVDGVEQVPARGPVLLVGNHNGGMVPSDGFFAALAIYKRYGRERALYALVHDFLLEDPLLRSYALRLGMLRAGPDSAHHVFAAGGCLLVYPGSDLDTFRPFAERGKVTLGGRAGFVKVALRERVPIVPVVSAGTHEQLIVLTRGDGLARLLNAHAWARTDVFPIVLALPWGLTSGFVPYLPLPAQTHLSFGVPIAWPELGPSDADRPDVVERCYHEVESRMQAILDQLMERRRFLLGPPRARSA